MTNLHTPDADDDQSAINVGFFNTEIQTIKNYVEESHVSPSGLQRDAFLYLMENADELSSENNINVTGIGDFSASSHQVNEKAYEFTLVKDTDESNDHRSRIGFKGPDIIYLPMGRLFSIQIFLHSAAFDCRDILDTEEGMLEVYQKRTFIRSIRIYKIFGNFLERGFERKCVLLGK